MATDVNTTAVATRTIPDSDSDTPPRPNPNKPMGFLAYANSALKRHYPTAPAAVLPMPELARLPPAVSYRECMRNHAATIGGHALDGCCEFMPSPAFDPADPTSLRCAACGCHRNFHRREPDYPAPLQLHRHINTPEAPFHPPALAFESPSSPPTPATFSSAPHTLMGIRKSGSPATAPAENGGGGRKRHRTKFSQEQKEKMYEFAEKLGWKLQKVDKGLVEDFCNEVGVGREVLKVWMHNNKNTIGNGNGNGTGEKEILNNGGNATVAAANINISNGGHHFELVHLVSANRSSSPD